MTHTGHSSRPAYFVFKEFWEYEQNTEIALSSYSFKSLSVTTQIGFHGRHTTLLINCVGLCVPFLVFGRVRKICEKRLLVSSCQSVCSHGTTRLLLDDLS